MGGIDARDSFNMTLTHVPAQIGTHARNHFNMSPMAGLTLSKTDVYLEPTGLIADTPAICPADIAIALSMPTSEGTTAIALDASIPTAQLSEFARLHHPGHPKTLLGAHRQ